MEAPVTYEVFVTKPCPVCGKEFTSYKVHNKRTCSRVCSHSIRKVTTYRIWCRWCHKMFTTTNKKRKFCCPEHYAFHKQHAGK